MLVGRTITIHTPAVAYDSEHDRVTSYVDETVHNVLIAPGNTGDVTTDPHVDGVVVDFTLAMPKTWQFHSLKGCTITLPAPWQYTGNVVGDPMPNDIDNCPTAWYCTVQLESHNG